MFVCFFQGLVHFVRWRSPGCQIFTFSPLKVSFHQPLASIVFVDMPAVRHTVAPFKVIAYFPPLLAFTVLPLVFSSFTITDLGVYFVVTLLGIRRAS